MAGKRDNSFARADIDTGLLTDAKVLRLFRREPDAYRAQLIVYLATVLSSWREGRRLTAVEAEGLEEVTDDTVEVLQADFLLDAEGRVPDHAWQRWFGPASERRDKRRQSGSLGGTVAAERRGILSR